MIDDLMERRNEEGKNVLEQAFWILFEIEDDRFILHLIENLPNVAKYLYIPNDEGWFPVFRILNLFQIELYSSDRITKARESAQKILNALFKVDYDFTKSSKYSFLELEDLSTFEVLLTISVDLPFFRQVCEYIWN